MDEHARHAEAERAVEAIARAAREDGRTRLDGDRGVGRADGDRLRPARHAGDAHAGLNRRAGVDGRRGEIAIEDRAIDDRRANALGVDDDRGAVGRDEARGIRGADDGPPREAELVERVEAEDAGAVHGRADDVVLLEHADA